MVLWCNQGLQVMPAPSVDFPCMLTNATVPLYQQRAILLIACFRWSCPSLGWRRRWG